MGKDNYQIRNRKDLSLKLLDLTFVPTSMMRDIWNDSVHLKPREKIWDYVGVGIIEGTRLAAYGYAAYKTVEILL